MKKIIAAIALFLSFTLTTFAQNDAVNTNTPVEKKQRGRTPQKIEQRGENLKTDLGLTDDQFSKVKELGNSTKGKLKAVRMDNNLDKTQKRTQMKQINEEYEAGMKSILSDEQYSKWQTKRQEERQKVKDMREKIKGKQPEDGGQ